MIIFGPNTIARYGEVLLSKYQDGGPNEGAYNQDFWNKEEITAYAMFGLKPSSSDPKIKPYQSPKVLVLNDRKSSLWKTVSAH